MARVVEIRSGQASIATWHKPIHGLNNESLRYDVDGVTFWCAEAAVSNTSKSFRDGIQGKDVSVILVSSNVSKLEGVDSALGAVVYKGARRLIVSAAYDSDKHFYTLGLK